MKNKYIRGLALGMAAMTAFTFTTPQASLLSVEAATATKATKGTSKITASKKSVSLTAGKSTTVKVTLNKKQDKALKITLKSKNAKIAKVAKSSANVKKGAKAASFKITAVKAGSTNVIASFKTSTGATKKATIKVTVKAKTVALSDVSLNNNTPKVGDVLTATISPSNATGVTYAWYMGDSADSANTVIGGETSNTLKVTEDMAGKFIKVIATGSSGNASATTASAVPAQTALTAVSLDKTALKVGDTVKATVIPENATNVSYQWLADGVAIDGATSASFTVTEAQLGKKISVKVSGDANSTATSAETDAVVSANVDVAIDGVVIDNTTPKIGDKITASISPSNASVVGYVWSTGDSADGTFTDIAGQTDSSLTVTAAMKGKFIKVTVTDNAGSTVSATTTAGVAEDASSSVTITDDYGLQSDGTGIVSDRLRVTFGADFGVPRAITWYRDGAVLTSMTDAIGIDRNLTHIVAASEGTGTYYATVTDNNGVTHKTNEIVISAKEDPAVINSFTVEDDYTDGTDINYAETTRTQVATVTMNKNFQGTFTIYKKTDTKFSTPIDRVNTANNIPQGAPRTTDANTDASTVLTASASANYDVLQQTPGSGQGFISNDGKVTYKWIVNGIAGSTAGLVRGTEYVVVFDQQSRVEDNIGRGTENVFSTAATSPYLTKPAKIEITKAAKNAPVEVTFYNENNDVMNFMGLENAIVGIQNIGAKSDSELYSATKTGVAVKDASKKNVNTALGSIKAGVWTTNINVSGTDAFWFANLNFSKGIYGADEFTLRSADKQVAYDAATAMTISYDKKNANDIKVSFTNLRTRSNLYLVAKQQAVHGVKDAVIVSDETTPAAFTRVYNEKSQAVASATVEPGAESYTFTGAIKGINLDDGSSANQNGNTYIAVLIPEDENNYSPTHTSTPAGSTVGEFVTVAAELTTYKIGGTDSTDILDGAVTTSLVGVDQFGKDITFNNFTAVLTRTALAEDAADACTGNITLAGAAVADASAGSVLTLGAPAVAAKKYYKDHVWEATLSTGQKLVATCTKTSAAVNDTTATWTITVK